MIKNKCSLLKLDQTEGAQPNETVFLRYSKSVEMFSVKYVDDLLSSLDYNPLYPDKDGVYDGETAFVQPRFAKKQHYIAHNYLYTPFSTKIKLDVLPGTKITGCGNICLVVSPDNIVSLYNFSEVRQVTAYSFATSPSTISCWTRTQDSQFLITGSNSDLDNGVFNFQLLNNGNVKKINSFNFEDRVVSMTYLPDTSNSFLASLDNAATRIVDTRSKLKTVLENDTDTYLIRGRSPNRHLNFVSDNIFATATTIDCKLKFFDVRFLINKPVYTLHDDRVIDRLLYHEFDLKNKTASTNYLSIFNKADNCIKLFETHISETSFAPQKHKTDYLQELVWSSKKRIKLTHKTLLKADRQHTVDDYLILNNTALLTISNDFSVPPAIELINDNVSSKFHKNNYAHVLLSYNSLQENERKRVAFINTVLDTILETSRSNFYHFVLQNQDKNTKSNFQVDAAFLGNAYFCYLYYFWAWVRYATNQAKCVFLYNSQPLADTFRKIFQTDSADMDQLKLESSSENTVIHFLNGHYIIRDVHVSVERMNHLHYLGWTFHCRQRTQSTVYKYVDMLYYPTLNIDELMFDKHKPFKRCFYRKIVLLVLINKINEAIDILLESKTTENAMLCLLLQSYSEKIPITNKMNEQLSSNTQYNEDLVKTNYKKISSFLDNSLIKDDVYIEFLINFLNLDEDVNTILKNDQKYISKMCPVDLLAVALLYLNDENLNLFKKRFFAHLDTRFPLFSLLDNLYFADLNNFLQNYLDATCDIQNVAYFSIISLRNIPTKLADKKSVNCYISYYKTVLKQHKLFNEKCFIDMNTETDDKNIIRIGLTCNYCRRPVVIKKYTDDDSGAANEDDSQNLHLCEYCKKSLPKCCICQSSVAAYIHNEELDSEGKKSLIDFMYCVCQLCHHGGHYLHIKQWFCKYQTCPVFSCNCVCNNYRTL